jgi:hypothetical protein
VAEWGTQDRASAFGQFLLERRLIRDCEHVVEAGDEAARKTGIGSRTPAMVWV